MNKEVNYFASCGFKKVTDHKLTWKQIRALAISQYIRNELEVIHSSHQDALRDKQMRAINIIIRKAVYDAFEYYEKIPKTSKSFEKYAASNSPEAIETINWLGFQLATYSPEYMEMAGTGDIEIAYKKYVEGFFEDEK